MAAVLLRFRLKAVLRTVLYRLSLVWNSVYSTKNKLVFGSSVSEPVASRTAMLPSAGL